jgi:hypothetical protein
LERILDDDSDDDALISKLAHCLLLHDYIDRLEKMKFCYNNLGSIDKFRKTVWEQNGNTTEYLKKNYIVEWKPVNYKYANRKIKQITKKLLKDVKKSLKDVKLKKGGIDMPRRQGACGGNRRMDGSGGGKGNYGTKNQPKPKPKPERK